MYVIVERMSFFAPKPDLRCLVRDEAGGVALFKERSAARSRVRELDDEVYFLSHGQSGRGEYTVRSVRGLPEYLRWEMQR